MKQLLVLIFFFVMIGLYAHESKAIETYGYDEQISSDRIVLITGSTSGLGREVARGLVEQGAHVIIHGRSEERGDALAKELNDKRKNSARFYAADFGSLSTIKAFAESIKQDYKRLDVLINNAGIALIGQDERRVSEDGYELHFQVNYLAGFMLTDLLMPLLEKGRKSRIINVSSLSASPLDFDNLMLEKDYSSWRAYGQSKLAQVMYTIDLSEKLKAKSITVNALHPGTFMDTNMVISAGLTPRSSVMDGRDAVLQLVNGEDVGNGEYYDGLNKATPNEQAFDESVRAQLWQVSKELIDQK
ncbi:MAG: SDR family NAD(P)-dependent oxidoreductase [Bacteroidetes bacterium]|nr:SDR family NAD(P)-dependent oxidoreductase [Bacteroidota bacterium]MDA1122135.1 SDR family NAD(P)-dependent oxidoreductase [Bacteroidota bacterium]